jgi:hypothetical protein
MTGHGAGLLWVVELDSEQQIQHGLVHLVICVSCVISPDGAVEGRMFGYVFYVQSIMGVEGNNGGIAERSREVQKG